MSDQPPVPAPGPTGASNARPPRGPLSPQDRRALFIIVVLFDMVALLAISPLTEWCRSRSPAFGGVRTHPDLFWLYWWIACVAFEAICVLCLVVALVWWIVAWRRRP
ncbi:MAG: hypothetical protein AB7K09_13435 [Planctomycetota bacterium]